MKTIKKIWKRIGEADPSIWGYMAMGYNHPFKK